MQTMSSVHPIPNAVKAAAKDILAEAKNYMPPYDT